MAHNEADNIETLLESLLHQKLDNIYIKEIIIIASGCVDNTEIIANNFLRRDSRAKVLIQERREGKSSAVNLFLKTCSSDIVVILNGDLILKEDTIQNLLEPFFDSRIGMTGGRAIPVNSTNYFMGFASYFLWEMHHEISLKYPKLGELVAYRNLKDLHFPIDTVDDEGIIESFMEKHGYLLKYTPKSVFYNRGPLLLSEFIKRRRNIFAGHLQLWQRTLYAVSTINPKKIFAALFLKIIKIAMKDIRYFLWIIMVIFLEIFARILAGYDFYVLKKDHSIWDMAKSSRQVRYDKAVFRNTAV